MTGFLTVTTPAATLDLTDLATVKADLGVLDGTQDAYLARLITRASGIVQDYCGRTFGVASLVEVFAGAAVCGYPAMPYSLPMGRVAPLILSRASVVGAVAITDANGPLVAGTDYQVEGSAGLVYRVTSSGVRTVWTAYPVSVIYQAGYAVTPAAVVEAVISLIAAAFYATGRDPAISLEAAPDLGQTRFKDRGSSPMALDDALAARLASYVSRVF